VLRDKEFGFNTDQDFADKWEINPETLVRWKKDLNFWERVKKFWRNWGMERTPDVILGLYINASKNGRAADALAWMTLVEGWNPKTETEFSMTRRTLQELQEQQRTIIEMSKERRRRKVP